MNRMVKFAGAGHVLFLFPLLAVLGPDALVLHRTSPDDVLRTMEETARAEEAPPDGLLARIEGEREGQVRAMEFPLQRTACP